MSSFRDSKSLPFWNASPSFRVFPLELCHAMLLLSDESVDGCFRPSPSFGAGMPAPQTQTRALCQPFWHSSVLMRLWVLLNIGNKNSPKFFRPKSSRPKSACDGCAKMLVFFSRTWRAWPKFLLGCPQAYPAQNFIFGLSLRSWQKQTSP